MIGCLYELVFGWPEGVSLEHPEHLGAFAVNNGNGCQKCGTNMEWQDRMFGRVMVLCPLRFGPLKAGIQV